MAKTKSSKAEIENVFAAYPPHMRGRLVAVRGLILQVAKEIPEVGEIEEALRWQQPSFLTTSSGSGSTIRIDAVRGREDNYAVYFNCNTTLVDDFKQLYPKVFKFEGNRALIFNVADKLPMNELRHCISLALTYHLRKESNKPRRK